MSGSNNPLPVVRWLQLGAAAAGVGMALATGSATAWADDGAGSSAGAASTPGSGDAAPRPDADGAPPGPRPDRARGSTIRRATDGGLAAADPATAEAPRAGRPVRAGATTARQRDADAPPGLLPAPARGAAAVADGAPGDGHPADGAPGDGHPADGGAPRPAAEAIPPAQTEPAPGPTPAAAPAPAPATQPKAPAAAAAPAASAAPGLGSLAATLSLNLEDLFTGTGAPVVSNPNAVVTGLFKQVLRRDPTPTELRNYLNRLTLLGVNGVVAGLYTSDAFRQNAVNDYYLELLGRTPTQQELSLGSLRLALGTEPNFAASLAGGQEFYQASASGGGPFGTQPSATTYVDLLHRSMLGAATPSNSVDPLVQRIQGGLPIPWAASQFVNGDAYRTVKVGAVYQVLGQEAPATDVAGYVRNWLWSGGQGGISRSLLATSANVARLEAGLVPFPDTAAAGVLRQLLLAPYVDGPTGFNARYKELVGDCRDTASPACKDPAAYNLIKTGGLRRGIPNASIATEGIAATVASLVPTQNEINLGSSLSFPLRNDATLESYFKGGVINHPVGPLITANDGAYIVDGHHRWSGVYLINPNTEIIAVDLGYAPNPKAALREAQFGIVATTGVLKESQAGSPNVYTVTRPVFDDFVDSAIGSGSDPAAVIATFGKHISTTAAWAALSETEKMTAIQDYLWANVLRMRVQNPYIPEATSRVVMPQFDPVLPVLQNLGGGSVSFSFPTISHLG